MTQHILLIETPRGEVIGVGPFTTVDRARAYEDSFPHLGESQGVVRLLNQSQAILDRLSAS